MRDLKSYADEMLVIRSDLFLCCLSFLFLFVNFIDNSLNLVARHEFLKVVARNDAQFNALFAFDDFEESLDCQADCLLFRKTFLVFLFEEFAEFF